jgi:glycosidase
LTHKYHLFIRVAGDYRERVGPGLLHSATNYQLSKALWSSLNDGNYFELAHCLARSQEQYHGLSLLEFIGNHDVSRLASRLACPEHLELATAALLLGVGGMPCLYYGDELAMEGLSTKDGGAGCDADVRKPLPEALLLATGEEELPLEGAAEPPSRARRLLEAVAEMLEARRAFPVLACGSVQLAAVSNGQLATIRSSSSSVALLLFNCEGVAVEGLPSWANHTPSPSLPVGKMIRRVLAFSEGRRLPDVDEAPLVEVLEQGRLRIHGGLPSRSVSVYITDAY